MLAAALERMVNTESSARFFLAPLPLDASLPAASSHKCIIIERARRRQSTQEIDWWHSSENDQKLKFR